MTIMRTMYRIGDMSIFLSCIWITFTQIHNNIWGYNHILNMTRLLRGYDAIIYAYICSMVKGRLRTLNHPKSCARHARGAMARGYGAGVAPAVRYRAASDPWLIQDHPLIGLLWRCVNPVYYFVGAWSHVDHLWATYILVIINHVHRCAHVSHVCYDLLYAPLYCTHLPNDGCII